MSEGDATMSSDEEVVLRVSGGKRGQNSTKRLASAICWRLREVGFAKMRAVKAEAVSAAIKSVAVANQKVSKADIDLSMDPILTTVSDEESTSDGSQAIEMTIQASVGERPEEFSEYKVSGRADDGLEEAANKLAGAIASLIREGGGARLRCIGPSALYKAINAIVVGKGYLHTNGIAMQAVPTWASLPRENDTPISLIQIDVWGYLS
jgi:stage V sporulation protein SpoVS